MANDSPERDTLSQAARQASLTVDANSQYGVTGADALIVG
jgi:hypothetical protein